MVKILHNGHIWSQNEYKNWMIIEGNMVTDIGNGSPKELEDFEGEIFDLQGKFVFPGLIDSHIHTFGLGRQLHRLRLDKPGSIAELQNKLQDYAEEHAGDWIVGANWDQDYWEDDRMPNKEDLDIIVSDKPVILFRGCHHIGVANTRALELMKVDSQTEVPVGGGIDLDSLGNVTGILRETALDLVTPHIKITDKAEKKRLFLLGLERCLSDGLTSIHTNDPSAWEIYKEIQEEGKLPIRIFLTGYHREIESNQLPPPNSQIGLLTMGRIKLFADGSLGAQTAWMREPYTDTGKLGLGRYTLEEMTQKVLIAKNNGYRVEIHAIGDKAAEISIDAMIAAGLNGDDRPVLTHCQILGIDLIDKMKKHGIIANIQPPFVNTDSMWVEKRLGKDTDRYKYAYAWKTIIDNDIVCAGGSDAPIENPNPFLGLFAAIFRHNPRGEIWKPEECLTFTEALEIYTTGGAYTCLMENALGRIENGMLADFVVINQDVANNPNLLPSVEIHEVWVDGQIRDINS